MGKATESVRDYWVVGLTGGIASGKSTVARYLAGLGFVVIDADQVSRLVTQPGSPQSDALLQDLRDWFGDGIFAADGGLDRPALRQALLQGGGAKAKLESLMHPRIQEMSRRLMDENVGTSRDRTIFYEATLLFESGRAGECDFNVTVVSRRDWRHQRLLLRGGMSREEAERMLDLQEGSLWPEDEKRRKSTWIIENNGTESDLHRAVDEMVSKLEKKRQESQIS